MTLDDLPPRWRLAAGELGRGAFDMPWSAASWTSVLRRSAVLTGFVAYGVATGNLDVAAFAAFGALQLGLGEAVLPWRGLARLIAVQVLVLCGVVFVATSLAGTWWTVPFLTVLAFAQGSTASVGLAARATAIGALALGVIFAGLTDVDPVTATVWLGLGAATQGLVWLAVWRRERDLSVRRALANSLRMVADIAGAAGVSGSTLNEASAHIDEVRETIRTSGFRDVAQAVAVADAIDEVRRTVVAWRILREPGTAECLAMLEAIRGEVHLLDETWQRPHPVASLAEDSTWAVTHRLRHTVLDLHDRIDELRSAPKRAAAVPGVTAQAAHPWSRWRGLNPGSTDFRHGVRMAVAIALAQVAALLVPFGHAFWIPLTVVFVVKPEWSFTVVRSVARVLGNLGAVILIPVALAVAGGSGAAIVILVAIVGAVAFRYFSGNYIAASFGVAGTILILDQTMDSEPELYAWRIVATVIGAAIGILVSAVIPSWRGRIAPQLLAAICEGLGSWQKQVLAGIQDPAAADVTRMRAVGEEERNNLIALRPAVAAAMLEPRPRVDPRALMVATNAAERAHLSLLALTIETRIRRDAGDAGLDVSRSATATHEALALAARSLGADAPPPIAPPSVPPHRPTFEDDEAAATVLESSRLHQACVDFAHASAWVGQKPD